MDALAAAADAAAAAAVEEEMMRQQKRNVDVDVDEDAWFDVTKTSFDERGFARISHNGLRLVQVKQCCCAIDDCVMQGSPVSASIRCETCGFSSHHSCQKNLSPKIPWLKMNRICNGCVKAIGLLPTTIFPRSRSSTVDSNDADLMLFLKLNFRELDLEFVSKKQFNKYHQDYQDGLYDTMEEEEIDEEEIDEEEKSDEETETEEEGKILGYSVSDILIF
jgi:hypothetical protein